MKRYFNKAKKVSFINTTLGCRLLLILLLSGPWIVNSQSHTWERTNPGGGGAYSTVGASMSGIIITGSDLSGAYRSSDDGLTWDVIGPDKGMTETHVSGVGFHRMDGDILYIGTENGIFRSDDGGDTTIQVLVGGYITDIEFGTSTLSRGYASYHPAYNSNNGVVYRTTDNGMTWAQSSTDLPSGIRILKIIVNPTDANIVYILTGKGRFACGPAEVYRSTNGGVNWFLLTGSQSAILDFAIDPSSPSTVYISTMNADCAINFYWSNLNGSLHKSTDGGTTWGSALSNNTGVILIDANNSSTIRLIDTREPYPWISSSGTWTSTDGGSTFAQTGNVNNWDIFFNLDIFHSYNSSYNGICKTLGEDLSDPDNYYWVNYQWIFQTTDNGTTFDNIFTDEVSTGFWRSRGFDNVNMMDVKISEADEDIIYTAYFDIGLWRSLDRGESWQSCNPVTWTGGWAGNGGNCATVLADPERSGVVWASMSGSQNGQDPTVLIKNTNTGHRANWSLSNSGLPTEEVMGLSLARTSPMNNRTLFVTALGDVYKSTDDGQTWAMVLDCDGCRFTAVDHIDGNKIYAGGEAGLWRSINGGSSWTDVSHADMTASLGVAFWDDDYDGVFDVQVDPTATDKVYVTALGSGKGLYKSINGGTTWSHIRIDDYMRKVAVVTADPDKIYATSSSAFEAGGYDPSSSGILYSEDGGQNWTTQNQDMVYTLGMAVAVDHTSTPVVFVGSPGTGFQKSDVPRDCGIVTNIMDSGEGSLRYVIDCASAGDTVIFSPSLHTMVITISSTPLLLDKNIILFLDNSIELLISAQTPQTSALLTVFDIGSGVDVAFDGIDIRGAFGPDGTAIRNEGNLTLKNVFITGEGVSNPNSLLWNKSGGQVTVLENVFLGEE